MRVCGGNKLESDPYNVPGLDPNDPNFNFGIVSPGAVCQGLSLRILHPFGTLSVNAPEAEASIKVGRNSPVTPDKVASNTLIP
jgi:hypothetical protein